jgi:proteasome lid subunit RPN8/RPN11
LFGRTLAALEQRSSGARESGAVWSGIVDGPITTVLRVDFHHELCDDRATALSMELSEEAKFRLYGDLRKEGLKLAALVHTHPAEWVGLSEVDRENQLCSRLGFWSLVVPRYGRGPWLLEEMGIHIQTESGWYQMGAEEATSMVSVEG